MLLTFVVFQGAEHFVSCGVTRLGPNVNDLLVTLTMSDETTTIEFLNGIDFLVGFFKTELLSVRNDHVCDTNGATRVGSFTETESLQTVQASNRFFLTHSLEAAPDDVGDLFLTNGVVDETKLCRPDLIETHTTDGGLDERLGRITEGALLLLVVWIAITNLVVHTSMAFRKGKFDFRWVVVNWQTLENISLLFLTKLTQVSQEVATERNVLGWSQNWLTASRAEQVVRRKHEQASFQLSFHREWHVNGHLVTIKVSIVSTANERMHTDSFAFDEFWLKGLNGKTMECRSTVQENWMSLGDFIKNVPHFRCAALNHLLGRADGVNQTHFLQATNDEWLEQDESHLLRKTALIESEIRTDNNNGTTRVIDALAEKILTETTGLAFKHVGEGLQRTIACTSHWAAMATVVEQGVHSFLQHALLITNDDIRCAQLEQVLETVVTIDDATIEIVQVGGRKAATFQRHERTKIRRNDWKNFHDHGFWTAVRLSKALAKLQALGQLLADLLGLGLGHRLFQFLDGIGKIDPAEDVTDGFSTHAHAESVCTVLFFCFTEINFGQQLTTLQWSAAWLDDHVVFIIDDALKRAGRHIQHETDA